MKVFLLTLVLTTSTWATTTEIVKSGCTATKTYEDEAKCFRVGIDELSTYDEKEAIYNMCVVTKSYESEAKCQRSAIESTSDYDLKDDNSRCVEFTSSYEQEVRCTRSSLTGASLALKSMTGKTERAQTDKL
jgi:hypothetical protein